MNGEKLFDAITMLPDTMVEEAGNHVFRKRALSWKRYSAIAAAMVLVAGIGAFGLSRRTAPASGGDAGSGNGGDGSPGAYQYMSYAGPVFPMTALGDHEGISAKRHTDFDFSPYQTIQEEAREENGQSFRDESCRTDAAVTDRYSLSNQGTEDKTLTLLYPTAIGLNARMRYLPQISLNGVPEPAEVHAGPYGGSFVNMEGQSGAERWNLDGAKTWEDYKQLLEDGSYLSAALAETPELDQHVTVYKVSDYVVAETDAVNPTLMMSFSLDYGKTTVLTCGSNGGNDDRDKGLCGRMVGGLGKSWAIHPMYLILLGDDIDGYTLQGYRNGGCEAGDEIDISASVERYESTLGEELRRIVAGQLQSDSFGILPLEEDSVGENLSSELVYRCLADMLLSYGMLNNDPAERYDFGMLEDLMGDSFCTTRICYLSFDVTIPSGDSVEITVRMDRQASFDYYGMGTEKGYAKNGFDLVTVLGSALDFSAQYASVSGLEAVELLDDSFGFDPASGVTELRLDPSLEHYWLMLRKLPEE